jgi:hypothetical protein
MVRRRGVNTDDPAARDEVTISNGQPVATADIVTNIDAEAPEVVTARPDGVADVTVDGAIVITFSEAIDLNTIRDSFSLRDMATNTAQGGNIALIRDDTQIVFTPSPPLAFGTDFRLRFDTDLQDHAGNSLAADYTLDVTTEAEPPVSISSLAPNKGIAGTTVVITGRGFDASPLPVVSFNGSWRPCSRERSAVSWSMFRGRDHRRGHRDQRGSHREQPAHLHALDAGVRARL